MPTIRLRPSLLAACLLLAACSTSGVDADGSVVESGEDAATVTRADEDTGADADGGAGDREGGAGSTSPVGDDDDGARSDNEVEGEVRVHEVPSPVEPHHDGPMQLRCGDLPTYGPFDVPEGEVSYTFGSAALTVTEADGSTTCINLTLDEGVDNVYRSEMDVIPGDPTGPELSLRWAAGGSALEQVVTHVPLHEGPFQLFTRFEWSSDAWVDSLHDVCEVELTHMEERAIYGAVRCDALPPAFDSSATVPISIEGVWYAAR